MPPPETWLEEYTRLERERKQYEQRVNAIAQGVLDQFEGENLDEAIEATERILATLYKMKASRQ